MCYGSHVVSSLSNESFLNESSPALLWQSSPPFLCQYLPIPPPMLASSWIRVALAQRATALAAGPLRVITLTGLSPADGKVPRSCYIEGKTLGSWQGFFCKPGISPSLVKNLLSLIMVWSMDLDVYRLGHTWLLEYMIIYSVSVQPCLSYSGSSSFYSQHFVMFLFFF